MTLYLDGDAGRRGPGRGDGPDGRSRRTRRPTSGPTAATPVSDDYGAHDSKFNGRVRWVQIDLGEDAEDADHLITPEERYRVAMARQ